jgi:hypothetical protein
MASNCNMSDVKVGYVQGYLLPNTKAVFWIIRKCVMPAYIFSERPGFNVLWNNTDELTGLK